MFKSSHLLQELNYPSTNSLTPIRDYDNDYFHSNDDKLPQRNISYRISNPYRHFSNISSVKRPASLDLKDIGEPLAKKMTPSPLNIKMFDKMITLNSAHTPKSNLGSHVNISEFIQIVKRLYETEIEYTRYMKIANNVYRKNMHDNMSFKNKLLKKGSQDEILLFGNIDTISSISRIFILSLKDMIIKVCGVRGNEINEHFWKILENDNINFNKFDIGDVLEQHLHRIKSAYLNYFVAQERQLDLYFDLQQNKAHTFEKWTKYCMKRGQLKNLEDILKRPMSRLNEWLEMINELCICGEKILNEELKTKLNDTFERYQNFKKHINDEMTEYNSKEKFDFTLTPLEIIQAYSQDNLMTANSSDYGDENKIFDENNDKNNFVVTDNNDGEGNSEVFGPPINNINSLPENMIKFKKVFRDLNLLKSTFTKINFMELVNKNLQIVQVWNQLVKIDEEDYNMKWNANEKLFLPISQEYIDEIIKLKEKVTILELTDFEIGIITPINRLLKLSYRVRHQLKDLKSLKKDYIIYLKEKKTNVYDVKRDVIGKHYETLQNKLVEQLPQFIQLVHKIVELVLLNYNKLMLKFFELMSGGNTYLQKDIAIKSSNKGNHMDILQSYSESKYYTKRLVRDEWPFANDPTTSKIVRQLFEL